MTTRRVRGVGSLPRQGHRTVPHTADIRIEAWAGNREECVAEAVRAVVAGCADIASAAPSAAHACHWDEISDEELLVAVLEEVIYRMEVAQEIPVAVEIAFGSVGVDVTFAMAPVGALPQVGAVPKAVSLHELRFGRDDGGWSCSVTADV